MAGDSGLDFLNPYMTGMAGSAQLQNPLASTPPPAMGGKYGGIDPALFAKMMRSFGGGAPRAYDPRSSAALQMRRAPEGEFASRGNLVSPQLAEILNIGSKIAGLV